MFVVILAERSIYWSLVRPECYSGLYALGVALFSCALFQKAKNMPVSRQLISHGPFCLLLLPALEESDLLIPAFRCEQLCLSDGRKGARDGQAAHQIQALASVHRQS